MSPRKPGEETLTRERIVDAALRIVDAEGAQALSMRRLGAVLGVDATTIYYHVPNKSALQGLVVDAVMHEVDLRADEPSAPPTERVMTAVHALAGALLAHPRALTLFASRSLTSPASLRPIEHLLGVLREAGMDYPHGIAAVNAIAFYVLGATTAYAAQLLDEGHQAQAVAALSELPAGEFPHLSAAVAGPGLLEKPVEFELGARALVTGLVSSNRSDREEPQMPYAPYLHHPSAAASRLVNAGLVAALALSAFLGTPLAAERGPRAGGVPRQRPPAPARRARDSRCGGRRRARRRARPGQGLRVRRPRAPRSLRRRAHPDAPRLRLQADHLDGGDATRRAGPDRSRRGPQRVPGFRDPRRLRRAGHHAPPAHAHPRLRGRRDRPHPPGQGTSSRAARLPRPPPAGPRLPARRGRRLLQLRRGAGRLHRGARVRRAVPRVRGKPHLRPARHGARLLPPAGAGRARRRPDRGLRQARRALRARRLRVHRPLSRRVRQHYRRRHGALHDRPPARRPVRRRAPPRARDGRDDAPAAVLSRSATGQDGVRVHGAHRERPPAALARRGDLPPHLRALPAARGGRRPLRLLQRPRRRRGERGAAAGVHGPVPSRREAARTGRTRARCGRTDLPLRRRVPLHALGVHRGRASSYACWRPRR